MQGPLDCYRLYKKLRTQPGERGSWGTLRPTQGRDLPAARTQGPDDHVQLVHVRLARPEWLACEQLSAHAACGPDVHRRPILRVPHQQLGRPVPARGHVLGVGGSWDCRDGMLGGPPHFARLRWLSLDTPNF